MAHRVCHSPCHWRVRRAFSKRFSIRLSGGTSFFRNRGIVGSNQAGTNIDALLMHLRSAIVQVVVALHHPAAGVSEPAHDHEFRDAAVGAGRTEVVLEAVQSATLHDPPSFRG